MNRESALQVVKSIRQPILIEYGSKQSVQTYKILTSDGLLTIECPPCQPIVGPIQITEERLAIIINDALSRGMTIGGRKVPVIHPKDLSPDENLMFLGNRPKPNVNYWAYKVPEGTLGRHRGSASEDREALYQEYISAALLRERNEIKLWERLDENILVEMAELVRAGQS